MSLEEPPFTLSEAKIRDLSELNRLCSLLQTPQEMSYSGTVRDNLNDIFFYPPEDYLIDPFENIEKLKRKVIVINSMLSKKDWTDPNISPALVKMREILLSYIVTS